MKILTTYFANIKNLPKDILPVSICGKPIHGWSYPEYKLLAPTWSIYNEIKNLGGTPERYTERYVREILENLDPGKVVNDLEGILPTGYSGIALVCYEKPGDFCHRGIVKEWLKFNGYEVEEAESSGLQ